MGKGWVVYVEVKELNAPSLGTECTQPMIAGELLTYGM
jgi:hypothetical protein